MLSGLTISKIYQEVNDLHLDIYGYSEEDEETGETKHFSGKKDELDSTYNTLQSELGSLSEKLSQTLETTEETNSEFLTTQEEIVETKLKKWDADHSATLKKIRDLLPEALTAGLSSAFSEKKIAEVKSGNASMKIFIASIVGLIIVSLIPFGLNAYLFNSGKSLEEIITNLPNLLSSIVPLYIPLI